MTNSAEIHEAFKIGWCAKLSTKRLMENDLYAVVVAITPNYIACKKDDGEVAKIEFECVDELDIAGYLYGGELAGNNPIPKGQKFKIKDTGEIVEFHSIELSGSGRGRLNLEGVVYKGEPETIGIKTFSKSEIEPVFT